MAVDHHPTDLPPLRHHKNARQPEPECQLINEKDPATPACLLICQTRRLSVFFFLFASSPLKRTLPASTEPRCLPTQQQHCQHWSYCTSSLISYQSSCVVHATLRRSLHSPDDTSNTRPLPSSILINPLSISRLFADLHTLNRTHFATIIPTTL